MKIFYRKTVLVDIETSYQLETFLKERKIYKYFIKFPEKERMLIQSEIDNTFNISYKQIKPWLKKILKYPETIYDTKFLYFMGWDEKSIIDFITEKQKNNSMILSNKKKKNPELYFSSTTSNIEYWISKGYSLEDAKYKVSERQKTFSKEICVKKFGVKEGLIRFNKRQQKWIKTLKELSNYDEIQLKKNAYNYEIKNIDDLLKTTFFTKRTKSLILEYINSETIDDFVINIINNIDIKRYSDILPFYSSILLSKKYNKTSTEIKNLFLNKIPYSISKQVYGVPIYYNGIRFKSIKEYQIAIFLEENKLNYIYEKNYPNSNFKYDFFIPEKNCYIEYYGMLDGKNENNLDKNQLFYKEKMIEKNKFCEKNNLFLIQNISYIDLINEIKQFLCK